MYKFIAQNKVRFPSIKGGLTVEHLFDLPLKSASGCDLDSIAKEVNAELKGMSEESFVDCSSDSPRKKVLEVSLEVIKDIIKTKQEANAAEVNKAKKAVERKKILDAIYAKKDAQLSQASLEELEKKLTELDG